MPHLLLLPRCHHPIVERTTSADSAVAVKVHACRKLGSTDRVGGFFRASRTNHGDRSVAHQLRCPCIIESSLVCQLFRFSPRLFTPVRKCVEVDLYPRKVFGIDSTRKGHARRRPTNDLKLAVHLMREWLNTRSLDHEKQIAASPNGSVVTRLGTPNNLCGSHDRILDLATEQTHNNPPSFDGLVTRRRPL